MSQGTDRKRTIEARLDKLQARAQRAATFGSVRELAATLRGTLDLLSDVLLTDAPEPAPLTREQAEALTKRAT